jgi:hypothetical protein
LVFRSGHDAYVNELYVPALSSFLNGIEASLRVTLHLINKEADQDIRDLSPYRVLSNNLISQAEAAGMPVKYLAFNDEEDFFENLRSESQTGSMSASCDYEITSVMATSWTL